MGRICFTFYMLDKIETNTIIYVLILSDKSNIMNKFQLQVSSQFLITSL